MSLSLLTSIDMSLVAGGGKDDCVCFSGDLMFVIEVGHDDVSDRGRCFAICCANNYQDSYRYKNGPVNKCR